VRRVTLTREVHEKVREALDAGAYQRDAATYAGISPRTFYGWLNRAREAEEALDRGEPVESVDRDLVAFLHMVEGARARVAVDLLTVVQTAARRDWRAAAWFLERSYPEQWGKREPGKPGTSDPEDDYAFGQRVDDVLAEAERRWGTPKDST
jgi:transposase